MKRRELAQRIVGSGERHKLKNALSDPEEGLLPMDVSVTPSWLRVKTPGGCTELELPAEVRLVPSSCRGLQLVPGEGLHLRLQAQAEPCTGFSPCQGRTGAPWLKSGVVILTPLLISHFIRKRMTVLPETLSSW
uniref:Ubiquitin protein ligase E3D n=1 Tax=Catagonus wagneri TaxID=51154 RepID=A0A8C3WNS5_9CETA